MVAAHRGPAAPHTPAMHYDVKTRPATLKFNPFKALVVPRPIGWIATVDAAGRPNLAPYSFFNAISDRPPMVMFSSGGTRTACATSWPPASSPARWWARRCARR
jgi:hypothetical protein